MMVLQSVRASTPEDGHDTMRCNSGNSTGSGQVQAGRVAKKHGRIITSSPPDRRQTGENSRQIVGIRVAPVLSTQLANQQSHVRMSASSTRSLETAAFAIAIGIGGA